MNITPQELIKIVSEAKVNICSYIYGSAFEMRNDKLNRYNAIIAACIKNDITVSWGYEEDFINKEGVGK